MKYRIGLDIGIASVGWAVINEDKKRIEDLGVRIFDKAENPKDGSSLAKLRREARSMRRRIRRKRHRKERIKKLFIEEKILKAEEIKNLENIKISPWELRSKSLEEKLSNVELWKILLHISQRRGFKSNRKSEIKNKKSEVGKMLQGVEKISLKLEEGKYKTVGEMFYKDEEFIERKRNKPDNYSHTVPRNLLIDEIKTIFKYQKKYKNNFINNDLEKKYIEIFSSQRSFDMGPSKPSQYAGDQIEKMLGNCTFEPKEKRAPKASYTAERFVLLQKIINLKLINRDLTSREKGKLLDLAYKKNSLSYKQIRKELKLEESDKFKGLYGRDIEKLEDKKYIELKSYHEIRKAIEKNVGKEKWKEIKENSEIIDHIAYATTVYKNDEKIIEYLESKDIKENIIESILDLSFQKVQNLSLKAMKKIIPYLEKWNTYDKACALAGYDFKKDGNKNRSIYLPNIPKDEVKNPVVLRALTQTRKVLNAIIRKYGTPYGINVELARDLSRNFKDRSRIAREQEKYRKEKENAKEQLKTNYSKHFHVTSPRGGDILKWRLFEEQNAKCAYSLKGIDATRLYEKGYVEIDHIIPESRSFDNSYSNKVLVLASENQRKGNRIPYEYFGNDEKRWHKFKTYVESSKELGYSKKNKLLREKYTKEDAKEWKERNINDTRYISRFIKNYIERNLKFEEEKVRTIKGGMTSYLRSRWGLSKNREEGDKHHALDAVICAISTVSIEQKITEYAKRNELKYINEEYPDPETGELIERGTRDTRDSARFPLPWGEFRHEVIVRMKEDIKEILKNEDEVQRLGYDKEFVETIRPIFVSRMPRRKITGSIHKETIRSAKNVSNSSEDFSTIKTPLTKVNLSKLENMYGKENDMYTYNAIKERLEKYDNKPEKAFLEPIYKPKKDGTKGNLIKSIKIMDKQNTGVFVNGGIADNGSMIRTDVFGKNNKNYLVPIYTKDRGKPLPNKAIAAYKHEREWTVIDNSYKFKFSLYPNDLLKIEDKKDKIFGYYIGCDRLTGSLTIKEHDNPQNKKDIRKGIKSILHFEKYQVTVLGDYYKVKKEVRSELA